MKTALAALTALLLSVGSAAIAQPPRSPEPLVDSLEPFDATAPKSIDDLRRIEQHVEKLAEVVIPKTVGLRIGGAAGSGVIVSADGYVLTAGHVSNKANQDVAVILHDGTVVAAKTLGANHGVDSGMIKIVDKNPAGGDWPYAEIGRSKSLNPGDWCLCTGHPGGFQRGRAPVVRLGKVLVNRSTVVMTDCTLVGGDSGGPLFDMQGAVIGINSRIGGELTSNMHVPVDTFRDTWDRLAKAEVWGQRNEQTRQARSPRPYLGIIGDRQGPCKVTDVRDGSPAAKAGVQVGDVVKKFGDDAIESTAKFYRLLRAKKPGEKIRLELTRGEESLVVEVEIVASPRGSR
jgi:serine protease Do